MPPSQPYKLVRRGQALTQVRRRMPRMLGHETEVSLFNRDMYEEYKKMPNVQQW